MYVIPPEQNAEFVAHLEDVLEVYHLAYDLNCPVICMDEQPVQLVKETRIALPAKPGHPEAIDFEYERNGTANIFLFTEPLAGWRKAIVTEHRTAVDWAIEIQRLLTEDYANCQKIKLVCDQLNIHKVASLYQAFPPATARSLVERLEIHHTPKHGSWLNMAEIEFSILARQCLDQRLAEFQTWETEVAAWVKARNQEQSWIDWRFTTEDARVKLKRLYPTTND